MASHTSHVVGSLSLRLVHALVLLLRTEVASGGHKTSLTVVGNSIWREKTSTHRMLILRVNEAFIDLTHVGVDHRVRI
jgi:hypothetical protein